MNKPAWQALHESVIVGYFCQAVGWIGGARSSAPPNSDLRERAIDAINLSHNPFDPAVGDLLLQLEKTDVFPQSFFIFEMKVDWNEGIKQERLKFREKRRQKNEHGEESSLPPFDIEKARELASFPKSETAHLYGATAKSANDKPHKWLWIAPYWRTVLGDKPSPQLVLVTLAELVEGTKQGFTIEELSAYVQALNQGAEGGTKAAEGSIRLYYALRDYQQYLLNEHQVLRLIDRYVELQLYELEAEALKAERGAQEVQAARMRKPGGLGG